MAQEDTLEEKLTPGSILRTSRIEKNFSLEDVSEATRISLMNLRAIEDDDFDNLPAETFCRAFYSMYAKFLDLDTEDILARYLEHRGLPATPAKGQKHPPLKKSGKFSSYAEPAPIAPGTSLGVVITIFFLVAAGVCWFFNWNPLASFMSQPGSSPVPVAEGPLLPEPAAMEEPAGLDEVYMETVEQVDNDPPAQVESTPPQPSLDHDRETVTHQTD